MAQRSSKKTAAAKDKPAAKKPDAASRDNALSTHVAEPSVYDQLEAAGIDAVCQMIEAGRTNNEIAGSHGVSPSTLHRWLSLPAHKTRSARAREVSAEAWLDRGLETLGGALRKNGPIDASAARAFEQACARRAAIRNPKYRDAQKHEVVGKDDGPIKADVNHTISPADAYKQMLG